MSLELIPYSLFFIFGAVIGSFLNVVIYRLNSGFGLGGRSQCFSCGKMLHWYELVPILSFLVLRGRCSVCKAKISLQYPAIELLTGGLFTLLYWKWVMLSEGVVNLGVLIWLVLCLIAFSSLIVIAVYDLRHKIIPDSLSLLFTVTSFCYLLIQSPLLSFYTHGVNIFSWTVLLPILINVAAGPAFFLFFFVFWFFSKGTWMGLGDAKLAVGIGWFLGWSGGIAALMLAFWIGATISIALMLLGRVLDKIVSRGGQGRLNSSLRKITIKTEVPFAPFLVFALWLVFFLDITLEGIQFFIASLFSL